MPVSFHKEDLSRLMPGVGVAHSRFRGVGPGDKFGHNGAVGASYETIWHEGGLYAYLSAATVLQVSSDDADDTSAGAGARTVKLTGLDVNYKPLEETVTLNGTTQVATAEEFLRIYRIMVITAGASGWNEGTVYAGTGSPTAGKPAVVYASVAPMINQTLDAQYTVEAGHHIHITRFEMESSISKAITAHLFVRPEGEVFQAKNIMSFTSGAVVQEFDMPIIIRSKSDVEVRAKATGGGGDISARFSFIVMSNGVGVP